MLEKPELLKRLRGVILSISGWQRLQQVKQRAELQNKSGQPYTLEEMSERTGLSHNTLTKVHHRKVAVDRQSLESYFNAFGLTLESSDYIKTNLDTKAKQQQSNLQGPVPLDSPFYVERPPIEKRCDEAILQTGALIQIKAPRQMGKTSLMTRILNRARERGLYTLPFSLRLADASVFRDLDRFLYWSCAIITRGLGLPNRLPEYWDDLFGSNYNCTDYLENYLLAEIDSPVVLALDDVDVVFHYPEIATDFFSLLRAWYEKAKYGDGSSNVWQKLRVVVVHSTEVYVPLNINQSPFNVGFSIELPEFSREQVQNLAQRYGLDWSNEQANQLIALVGGNPYRVQLALYQIGHRKVTLEQLVQTAIAPDGIYSDHLRQQLWKLQQYPELLAALTKVMTSPTPVELEPVQAFKLQSIGLVQIHNQQILPNCQLYSQYFGIILPLLGRLPESSSDVKL